MAYPVLLNYLLSSVFELLDKAIVGHYSVQGFAVVGAAASFTYAITGALGILSAAFNIMIGLPVYAYATATQTYALQNHSARKMSVVKDYLKCGIRLTFGTITLLCVLCGVFRNTLLHLIVDDLYIIKEAQKLLLPVFLLQLVKIPYQIHMSYLQGVGREKFVLFCTAVGTICTSAGVIIAGNIAGLTGIYFIMTAELVILGICYTFLVS